MISSPLNSAWEKSILSQVGIPMTNDEYVLFTEASPWQSILAKFSSRLPAMQMVWVVLSSRVSALLRQKHHPVVTYLIFSGTEFVVLLMSSK